MTGSWTEQELEKLVKLLKDGWSAEMISRALNRTIEEIQKKIAELQIKPRNR